MARARWITQLREAGFLGSDERAVVVAEVLASNRLFSFRRVGLAGDPASWPGGGVLLKEEVEFLANRHTGGRCNERSRSRNRDTMAQESLVSCASVAEVCSMCIVSGTLRVSCVCPGAYLQ